MLTPRFLAEVCLKGLLVVGITLPAQRRYHTKGLLIAAVGVALVTALVVVAEAGRASGDTSMAAELVGQLFPIFVATAIIGGLGLTRARVGAVGAIALVLYIASSLLSGMLAYMVLTLQYP